jgi:hypothetical protein
MAVRKLVSNSSKQHQPQAATENHKSASQQDGREHQSLWHTKAVDQSRRHKKLQNEGNNLHNGINVSEKHRALFETRYVLVDHYGQAVVKNSRPAKRRNTGMPV